MSKKSKAIVILSITFTVFIVVFLVVRKKPDDGSLKLDGPTVSNVSVPSKEFVSKEKTTKEYHLNKIKTASPVLGFTWIGNELIIATKDSIVNLKDGSKLYDGDISSVVFSNNNVLINSSKRTLVSLDTKASKEIVSLPREASVTLSPDGSYFAHASFDTLFLTKTSDESIKTFKSTENIQKIFWTNKNNIAVESAGSTKILNTDLLEVRNFKYSSDEKISSISELEDKIVTHKDSSVKIYSSTQTVELNLSEGSELASSNWYSPEAFFFVEKTKSDEIGRRIDMLWSTTSKGVVSYITNSMPIVGRLAPFQTLKTDAQAEFLPLLETDGNLWIVSLKANLFPYFSTQGKGFLDLQYKQDEH